MIAPMELIDVTRAKSNLTNDNVEKQIIPKENRPLVERIYDIVTNLYFIIFFLISLNLIVISVWLYGLLAAISQK
jgi:hypothetical protein